MSPLQHSLLLSKYLEAVQVFEAVVASVAICLRVQGSRCVVWICVPLRQRWLLLEHSEDEFVAVLCLHLTKVLGPHVKICPILQIESSGKARAHLLRVESPQACAVISSQMILNII